MHAPAPWHGPAVRGAASGAAIPARRHVDATPAAAKHADLPQVRHLRPRFVHLMPGARGCSRLCVHSMHAHRSAGPVTAGSTSPHRGPRQRQAARGRAGRQPETGQRPSQREAAGRRGSIASPGPAGSRDPSPHRAVSARVVAPVPGCRAAASQPRRLPGTPGIWLSRPTLAGHPGWEAGPPSARGWTDDTA